MKLIIFDLDQTLVDFIQLHDEVTNKLFQKFFNVDARLTEIEFAGKSLADCLFELGRLKNVPEDLIRRQAEQLLKHYERLFAEIMPQDTTKYVLPGAKELLEALSLTDNLVVLYTGDSPDIVKTVLGATGLGKYFRFFFSGTDTFINLGHLIIL